MHAAVRLFLILSRFITLHGASNCIVLLRSLILLDLHSLHDPGSSLA